MSGEKDLGPHPTTQAFLRLVPKVGPIMATWREDMHERRKQRAELLGKAATETMDPEELLQHIASDERLGDMFQEAVDAALGTSSEAKVRLLGRALAFGASAGDDAAIDEAQQLLRVAVELDPVDLRAMRALERRGVEDPASAIAFALDVSDATAGPVSTRLQRLSLIQVERLAAMNDASDPQDDSVAISETWTTTPTAKALMRLLRGSEPTSDGDRVPAGAAWDGFSERQAVLLEDLYSAARSPRWWPGHRDSHFEDLVTVLRDTGLTDEQLVAAMRGAGYDRRELEAFDAAIGSAE